MSVEAAYDRLPGPKEAGKNTTENASSPNAGDAAQSATDGREDDADNGNPAEKDSSGNGQDAKDDAMHQATNLAKAEGKLPGAIAETVRGAHTARLDWRALLRRFLADSAKNDYSWSAPNHRFIDSGLYLP